MKTDLFQSCDHSWLFQICWHMECSTITASFFRIWNSSAGIPLPPLALFSLILLRPTWFPTQGCLALREWPHHHGCLCHYCHLFLMSSASVNSLPFLSFTVSILAWNVPLIIPVFPYFFAFPFFLSSAISKASPYNQFAFLCFGFFLPLWEVVGYYFLYHVMKLHP